MYSIGEISRKAGVKVPTVRYYEQGSEAPRRAHAGQSAPLWRSALERLCSFAMPAIWASRSP